MSVEDWISFAEEDLKMAKYSYDIGKFRYSCYFSQQAVEKFLKAFLVGNNRPFRRTHDLLELLDLCKDIDKSFGELEKLNLEKLTAFSTITRYPEFGIEVSQEDAQEALRTAEKVRDFVLKKLTGK
ncbi:MAG: DNA-binding protein [Thermofilum sp. ex4484_79]|nr:MAG: DNA-binding protein [Thermofilum sp. ex4484_79]